MLDKKEFIAQFTKAMGDSPWDREHIADAARRVLDDDEYQNRVSAAAMEVSKALNARLRSPDTRGYSEEARQTMVDWLVHNYPGTHDWADRVTVTLTGVEVQLPGIIHDITIEATIL